MPSTLRLSDVTDIDVTDYSASIALPRTRTRAGDCMKHIERGLHATLLTLLTTPGLVPPGAIIDAGANDGQESLWLANLQPSRQIVAVEPLTANVANIHKQKQKLKANNLEVLQGILSNRSGTDTIIEHNHGKWPYNQLNDELRQRSTKDQSTKDLSKSSELHALTFNVSTVDELFASRTLGLAHWDVEGAEIEVVQGAMAVLQRDQPFITVETFPKSKPQLYVQLMRLVGSLGYRSYQIKEICGYPWDCHNVLCVPEAKDAAFHNEVGKNLSHWINLTAIVV